MDFIITQSKGTCCLTSNTLNLQIVSFNCVAATPPGPYNYTLTQTSTDIWTGSGNSPCGIDGTVSFQFVCSGSNAILNITCVGGTYDGTTDSISAACDCTNQTWSGTKTGSTAQCVDLGTTWFLIT